MDAEIGGSRNGSVLQQCEIHEAETRLQHNEQPTPWAVFISYLSQYRGVILFIFLALVCLVCGTRVYFSTIHDEEYVLCCKDWINIHLVPHSHDDVGWLRTPEHYYENTVKYILNNVIYELEKNPSRKFTYVETYFFWRWWRQQSLETQDSVRQLIANGQLEFAGGGWTMSDEATPNYLSVIDQYTWGLRRLNDTFGAIALPTVGWQIDTFGHSREYVSLLTLMGFKGLFFARIDEDERSQRKDRHAMEFLWDDRDGNTAILTSIMYKHYNPPQGFHFEKESNEGANVELFVEKVRQQVTAYRTPNILVPMGDDFTYYDAKAWFDNMDALIRKVQERKAFGLNVNMFYSTPRQYLNAIKVGSVSLPVKQNGDFFPYSSDPFSFWSGYFTSRPSLKYFERVCANYMQMVKQLLSFSRVSEISESSLTALRESLAMILHHDGITGTAKQEVTDHYIHLLYEALTRNLQPIRDALMFLSSISRKAPLPLLDYCLRLNVSECRVSEQSAIFMVTAYNTLTWPVSRSVRLPVTGNSFTVRNVNGEIVSSQVIQIPEEVLSLPGRRSPARYELVFQTGPVPPLGFTSFHITSQYFSNLFWNAVPITPDVSIKLGFNKFTGRLSDVIKNGVPFHVEQDVGFYPGSAFWTGAYIFRPSDNYPYDMEGPVVSRQVSQGPVVEEFHQKLGSWSSQSLRMYHGSPVVEIDWLVGPIPIDDYQGKEVIVRYSSNIKSRGVFFTDTNGRGILRRERNKRDDWQYMVREDIAGNYYPVTSHISLRDNSSQMVLLTDRAQGGTSIADGQLELMIHRRLCYDDSKGVNEALNETEFGKGLVVRGRHWLLIGDSNPELDHTAKRMAIELQNEPILLLAPLNVGIEDWRYVYLNEWHGLRGALPPAVRVLTLEPWRDQLFLLRLEHMYEKIVGTVLSQPVTVYLRDIFTAFDIIAARETALGADRWLSNDSEWQYGDMKVVLEPTAIRTFLIQILPRH